MIKKLQWEPMGRYKQTAETFGGHFLVQAYVPECATFTVYRALFESSVHLAYDVLLYDNIHKEEALRLCEELHQEKVKALMSKYLEEIE